jgi:hypothetical protein
LLSQFKAHVSFHFYPFPVNVLCAAVVRAHGGAASLASGHTPFDADADMRHAVVDTEEPKAVKHCGWMLGQMSGGLDEREQPYRMSSGAEE